MIIRSTFLAMAVAVLWISVNQWLLDLRSDGPAPPLPAILAPVLLAGSLLLQFFAKHRGSKLRIWSLGLAFLALLMLVLLKQMA
jgi:hypothetical protein